MTGPRSAGEVDRELTGVPITLGGRPLNVPGRHAAPPQLNDLQTSRAIAKRTKPGTLTRRKVLTDPVVKILEGADRGLARAVLIQDYKLVADIADAQGVFARRQKLSQEVIGHAHMLKIEALAGLGEAMKVAPKAPSARGRKGGGTRGSKKDPQVNTPPTLEDQGVDKKTANLARTTTA